MPSLSHRALKFAIPRVRPSRPVTDVEKVRAALVRRNRTERTVPPEGLAKRWTIETRDIGFPVHVLTPRSGSFTRTLVHLHGGSFTARAHPMQWRYAARLASALDARLVFPAYPLAPEFTWRDSHEPLVELITDLAAEGPILLSGDSAGGGMALAVAQTLRDRAGAQPERLLLIAPWVDLTGETPGLAEAGARDPWLSYDNHDIYALFWAGTPEDLRRPEVSPGLGEVAGLPPALIFCGTHDLLFPACRALVARAAAEGWPVDFQVGRGLLHVYPILPVAEARGAFRHAVRFLRG